MGDTRTETHPEAPLFTATERVGNQPTYPQVECSLLKRRTCAHTRKYQRAYSFSPYGAPPPLRTPTPCLHPGGPKKLSGVLVSGGGSQAGVPGTPIHIPQHDPLVALIILKTEMWDF